MAAGVSSGLGGGSPQCAGRVLIDFHEVKKLRRHPRTGQHPRRPAGLAGGVLVGGVSLFIVWCGVVTGTRRVAHLVAPSTSSCMSRVHYTIFKLTKLDQLI